MMVHDQRSSDILVLSDGRWLTIVGDYRILTE